MRRAFGTLFGVVLLVAITAAPAAAQTYVPNGPTVSLSANVTAPGGTLTVGASGFPPGVVLTFTFNSTPILLGTATTDAAGSASLTFQVPNVAAGTHTVVASGGGVSAVLATLTVTGSTPTPVPTPTPASSGGLAFTGTDVTGLVLVGLSLLMAGGLAVFRGRRRRSA